MRGTAPWLDNGSKTSFTLFPTHAMEKNIADENQILKD
jgi:hypothetical protein